ncbi:MULTISPECIES: hypothetical protein [Pectobacterium]|uniref:DUF2594 family protein n=1 Tax=Pectobacterium brasiliense TaxID=180957 RepID=A0A0M2F0X2_9GAMM|nr:MULTISPECIES: hypothetical protein [Pectobacterium]KGA23723.1 hypothetical protein KS44_11300 [Pectobacterium brasiliense]KGA33639.1 hypothetical protein KU74_09105 [Pectobacterium brasiliense]KHT40057.1 hypothetical protein RD02_13535 [Pectobacterium brasiliense]KMK81679.1 hypothetical protein KCO_20087 [Pectobacterium brasiliense ICMP 19477]KRF66142.1 hypothetical protein AO825_00740 [Pectobacterium brasiliense]
MTVEKPEEAMTFGELLELIGEQQRKIDALELAFSSLAFCLDEKANKLMVHNLALESQNENRDPAMKKYLARLAAALEKNAGSGVE